MSNTHKLDMHTKDKSRENFEKLKALFPNAVTETVKDGKIVHAIDKDVLMQEINAEVVEGKDERYQFTWPEKKKAVLLANAPTTKTLRPCRDESVNFDSTKNLYIEGDNLEVLKLLQKAYLGKVKMIYIDPPYNTGNDKFIYNDSYKTTAQEFKELTALDDEGNLLYNIKNNPESNGYFHTDWLNMMYPRLRLARDLLTDDGVIFISIDEREYTNCKKICDEIFGEKNFFGDLIWEATTQPINAGSAKFGLQKKTETILSYARYKNLSKEFLLEKIIKKALYPHQGKFGNCRFEIIEKSNSGSYQRETMQFEILGQLPREGKRWQIGQELAKKLENEGKLEIVDGLVKRAIYPEDELENISYKPFWSLLLLASDFDTAQTGKEELNNIMQLPVGFETVKPIKLIKWICSKFDNSAIILDFFSGSATTAHAVMQLNAEDKGKRQFIMVQLPETTDEDSEAYKAGYKNICEIGKERIRRAGKKILQENNLTENDLDIGFRVLKLDTTNMKDVYYVPAQYQLNMMDSLENNIKEDRSPEDLLFQVLLDLGVELSGTIASETVGGKTMFNVENNYCIACFDMNLTDEIITQIAKKKPSYAVFRDKSFNSDSVGANVEQIFKTYSPNTKITVL